MAGVLAAVFWGLGLQFVLETRRHQNRTRVHLHFPVAGRPDPGVYMGCSCPRASWVAGDGGEASALEGGGLDCDQVVGVWGPPDPWAVGGWAAQLLFPSGLVPPAQTSSPFRGWPDVEENLKTGRFLGYPGPGLIALGPHQKRNLQ